MVLNSFKSKDDTPDGSQKRIENFDAMPMDILLTAWELKFLRGLAKISLLDSIVR